MSPQTPTTNTCRYPSTLSQAQSTGGPSRPNRQYPSPSIDNEIPSSSSAVGLHEYSSLADLLQQAGYKETRVYTPEAEKVRSRLSTRIRKTFEEEDEINEEVEALYGTYGFDRSTIISTGVGKGNTKPIQHKHITEPSMPMKRSTSILRSLAIQDAISPQPPIQSIPSTAGSTPDHSWWTNWGRATKVISPDHNAVNAAFEPGLGLAKGGEGVRKVKSTWELERSRPRRAGTDSPPQEERPPMPRTPSHPHDAFSVTGYTSTRTTAKLANKDEGRDIFGIASPPPPRAIEEEAYGYCPLPEDYEAQCTEDEAMYAMGVNDLTDIYSLGSAPSDSGMSRTPSVQSYADSATDAEADADARGSSFESDEFLNEVNEVGKRLLIGAVEYDDSLDYESPPVHSIPLPPIDDLPPIPDPTTESTTSHEQIPQPAEPAKKPLKYGDRATRLRLAHSTPALKQVATSSATTPPLPEGWLGTIRNTLLGKAAPSSSIVQADLPPPPSHSAAPIKISAITPARPTLVTASPVICDSTSTEAVDLPPVPPRIQVTGPTSSASTFNLASLRIRPSLAKLRDAVLGTAATTVGEDDGTNPVLSPRLDWGEQGEQFAGWSPARRRGTDETGVEGLFGLASNSSNGIANDFDYSKSFFYKPGTPRRKTSGDEPESVPFTPPRHGTSSTSTAAATSSSTDSNPKPNSNPIEAAHTARRQRSIKSLRAALLLPVAPSPALVPPVPAIPSHLMTPKPKFEQGKLPTPILAIQSPGAWEPRELVLEGEEWDARDGLLPGGGDWGRKGRSSARSTSSSGSTGRGGLKKRKSKKGLQRD